MELNSQQESGNSFGYMFWISAAEGPLQLCRGLNFEVLSNSPLNNEITHGYCVHEQCSFTLPSEQNNVILFENFY